MSTLEVDIELCCPDIDANEEVAPGDNDWQVEYDEYLRSIGQLGAVSVSEGFELSSMRILEKPRTNAKPKGYKSVADLGVYETEENKEEVILPTLLELEAMFTIGLATGNFSLLSNALGEIKDIEYAEKTAEGVDEPQIDVEYAETAEGVDEPQVTEMITEIVLLEKGLVHPDSAVIDRHEYLRQVKLRMFDGDENTDFSFEKVVYRAHRNDVLDAEPDEVAEIVYGFYDENPYLLDKEAPGKNIDERPHASVGHQVVRDMNALKNLFMESNGGGAGVKSIPSRRRVVLNGNQKRLAELEAIYNGNKRFYGGYEDEPIDQKPRRPERSRNVRNKVQNGSGDVKVRASESKLDDVQPIYVGHKPNILVMARGMRRTVTYL